MPQPRGRVRFPITNSLYSNILPNFVFKFNNRLSLQNMCAFLKSKITPEIFARINGLSYGHGCDIPLEDLAYRGEETGQTARITSILRNKNYLSEIVLYQVSKFLTNFAVPTMKDSRQQP